MVRPKNRTYLSDTRCWQPDLCNLSLRHWMLEGHSAACTQFSQSVYVVFSFSSCFLKSPLLPSSGISKGRAPPMTSVVGQRTSHICLSPSILARITSPNMMILNLTLFAVSSLLSVAPRLQVCCSLSSNSTPFLFRKRRSGLPACPHLQFVVVHHHLLHDYEYTNAMAQWDCIVFPRWIFKRSNFVHFLLREKTVEQITFQSHRRPTPYLKKR